MTHSLTHWLTDWLSDLLILTLQSDPRDLWPLRHLIRVMKKHDLTNIFWIWIHDNLCYLTINCDTGQHSQFLRCLLWSWWWMQNCQIKDCRLARRCRHQWWFTILHHYHHHNHHHHTALIIMMIKILSGLKVGRLWWQWWQLWQLRIWIHDNLCDLTINCDTGQHSQFLRCF